MSALPLVSIVTPSYNQAPFLEETIQSVLSQEYPRLQYIIMDGGSSDGSVDIIRKHAGRLAHWSSAPDGGQADAINRGWQMATGDVLAWLNSDDRLLPGALMKVGQAFAAVPGAAVVVGRGANIDQAGRMLGYKPLRPLNLTGLLLSETFHQPSVFLHRRAVAAIGLLNTGLRLVFDWEYWLRLFLAFEPEAIHYLDEVLAENRIWPGTKTVRARWGATGDERRQVLATLHESGSWPAHLRDLYPRAIAASYWRQAHLQREAGMGRTALKSARQAHELAPQHYPWSASWALQFWVQTYIRYPFWRIPHWAWRKVRRWLGREHD